MKYELMIPPFEYDNFEDFNKNQTEEYFQWYVNQINHRMEVLNNWLIYEGEAIELDYSPESLIPLWGWYEKHIILENKTEGELEQERAKYPEWMRDEISTTKISIETLKFAADIAIYFAETIIKNNLGKVYWGYFTKPKNRMSVNQPVILGFKANVDLDPRLIVVNCTRHSIDEEKPTRLYEMYKIWLEDIR